MPYREFFDDGGVWIVFGTQPRSGANVRPRYASGWLSFHRGAERRRLSPIPPGWEAAGDDQLRLWLRSSELVARATEDAEALTSRTAAGAGPRSHAGGGTAETEKPAVPPGTAPGPDGVEASPASQRLQDSVQRIRDMLSTVRGTIT